MATNPMTPEEREDFLFTLQPIDALEFVDFVAEHHPEVFDAAAAKVQRVRKNLADTARRTAKQTAQENS